jgi:hypothetical protein
MPDRNLRPRTAGCVSDHEEARNRCQQPRGRDHNPPTSPVERLSRRIIDYKPVSGPRGRSAEGFPDYFRIADEPELSHGGSNRKAAWGLSTDIALTARCDRNHFLLCQWFWVVRTWLSWMRKICLPRTLVHSMAACMNTAHQGPLPRVAVEATRAALEQKARPHLLRNEDLF